MGDNAKVPLVEGSDDVGAKLSRKHDVHRAGQSDDWIVPQNRVSGKQERADAGYLPATRRNPAGDIPEDGACSRRPLSCSDQVVEFGEDTR